MVRNNDVYVDLETSYLHLRTNSTAGSDEKTLILYSNEEGRMAGGIGIWFTSTIQYSLLGCGNYTNLTGLPAEVDRDWVIEKRGYRTIVYCNSEQVVDKTVSSVTCDDPDYSDNWNTFWGRDVTKIAFLSEYDTASDSFYIGKFE